MIQLKIDDADIQILQLLKRNGQESLKSLAEIVGMPRSTIHARIKRLEDAGIIKNYTINVNYKLLDYHLVAFIMISFDQYMTDLDQETVAEQIAQFPQVQEVHLIAGEWDIIIRLRVRDIDDLGDFAVKDLKNIKGVGKSLTYVSLKQIKIHPQEPFLVDSLQPLS